MWPGAHAASTPDKAAYVMAGTGETVTYRELDERSNRLAHLFHDAGLRFGDHIAICMENNARYLEVAWAAQRSGLYFTPVNYHFNAEEIAYILDDCDAHAFVTSTYLGGDRLAEVAARMPAAVGTRLVVGGPDDGQGVDGYDSYEDAVARFPTTPLEEELEGHAMLYSSGTTGRPKGIRYSLERRPVGNPSAFLERVHAAVRAGRGDRLPVARAAVPLRAIAVLHRDDAHRRHDGHSRALRRRGRARRDREVPGDAQRSGCRRCSCA